MTKTLMCVSIDHHQDTLSVDHRREMCGCLQTTHVYLILLSFPPYIMCCSRFLYYESIKRELQTRPINECRCDERLETKVEESTRLEWTLLCPELEHLKIQTRLINTTSVSEMGEYVSVTT